MRDVYRGAALTAAAILTFAASGCTASSTGPGPARGVTVAIRVTGGIAGVDYSIRVDGVERTVLIECVSGCPDPLGGPIGLSDDQWTDLVAHAQEAGLPALGRRDYGTTCCDFFRFDVQYQDSRRFARIQGDDGTLPPEVAAFAARLLDLASNTVPALFLPNSNRAFWPLDALDLLEARVEGLRLVTRVRYGGGCEAHEIDLRFTGEWMESHPVQTPAWITHGGRDDPCDALPTETRIFDLGPLVEAYRAVYPTAPSGERVRVNLQVPGSNLAGPIEVVLP